MRLNKLGRTGLLVSELCLGTMTFGGGGEMWEKIGGLDQDASERLLGRALAAGINFVDTADVYARGRTPSELVGQYIAAALKVLRDQVVLATKAYRLQRGGGPNPHAGGNGRQERLTDAVKASLGRLQMDHIDLYQIHGFDDVTPVEETIRALDTLVQHGHVRYVGVSNWAAWQVAKAQGIAERLGLARLCSLQAHYTLASRDVEREIVPMLRHEEVGLMVWSPLAGGLLSGKYPRGKAAADGRLAAFAFPPVDRARAWGCIDAMRPMAEGRGVSLAQIAIAWLLHQRAVSSVIVGARRMEQLDDNIAAAAVELTEAELDALAAVSALPGEHPGWMFETQSARRQQLAELGRPRAR